MHTLRRAACYLFALLKIFRGTPAPVRGSHTSVIPTATNPTLVALPFQLVPRDAGGLLCNECI